MCRARNCPRTGSGLVAGPGGFDLGDGLVPSIALVGSNANNGFYVPGAAANSSRVLGKSAQVSGVKYNL